MSEVLTTAIAIVTLEIPAGGPYGDDWTCAKIREDAERAAVCAIQQAMYGTAPRNKLPPGTTLIGKPVIRQIIVRDKT